MKNKTIYYILTLFLILSINSMAQVQGISINNPRYLDTSITTKSKAVVQTTNISLPIEKINLLKNKTVSGKLYFKLDLGQDLVLKKGVGQLGEIIVPIKYKFRNETTWTTLDLKIENDIVERLEIIDLTNELDNHIGSNSIIDIAIDGNITTTTTSTYFNNLIDNNLRLKATFLRTYNIGVRTPNNTLATAVTLSSLDGLITGRRADFKWTTNLAYPNYEFQLLKLINRDKTETSDSIAKNVRIDWSKALSIETQSYKKELDIIIAEGTGLYTWRVRPIGTYYKGGIANSDNYGNWSSHYTQNSVINFNNLDANVFFFKDPDEKLNWNYSRVFTEGDNTGENGVRISEGMTYADGLLRTRQSQQYNSADSTTIISQTISDYSGRPSLTTLPVPIANRDLSGYKENFVKNDSVVSTIYTAKDFDANGNYLEPRKINDNGDFSYYNGDNTEGLADAQGFSYSRTLFKTDGTGRATESSGVGQKHALGKRTDGKGRTTRVYYSSPSDQELIRIFGDEAPLSESVIRTTTIDPNDVISIAYTSKEGKTIATALLSNATENLQKLGGDTIANNFEVINSTNQNVLSNGKFISKKRIAIVANQTEVTLGYFLYDVASSCAGGCNYKLKFYLTDLSTNQTYKSPLFDVDNFTGNFTFENISDTTNTYVVSDGMFTLNSGEYMVTKEVYSANNPNLIAAAAMDRADQIEDVLQIIADSMALVNNNDDLERFKLFLSDPNNGLVFPEGFNVTYDNGIKITDEGEGNSNSSGSCASCGSTTVSLPTPDSCYFCTGKASSIGLDSIRNNATTPININSNDWNSIKSLVDEYFIRALNYKVNGDSSISIPTDSLYKYAPGFTTNSFSYMITNMLASKYYTGKRIKVGTDYYRAEENEDGILAVIDTSGFFVTDTAYSGSVLVSDIDDLEYNYDCEELYNCWTKSINMINNFEFEDDVNVMEGYNDSEGNGEAEEQSDSEDAQEGAGGGSKLMDFIISRKLRKFNDTDGETSKSELKSIVSLPNLFLSCAGRQFNQVIDDNIYTNLPADYSVSTPYQTVSTTYNGNLDYLFGASEYSPYNEVSIPFSPTLSIGAYAPKLMRVADTAEIIEVLSCDDLSLLEQGGNLLQGNNANLLEHGLLYYKYILKPEWMFKYFVYNSINNYNNAGGDTIDDKNHIIVAQRSIEISTNYNDPGMGCTSCFESNIYYHDSWSSGQLLNFYQQIKGGKKSSIECPADSTDNAQPFDVNSMRLSSTQLLDKVKTELIDAKNTCKSRKGEIRSKLISALNNACYEIVECNATPTQVSELGVDRMVDAVIAKCIAKVNTVTLHIFDNIDMVNADYNTSEYGDSPYGTPYSNDVTIDNNEGVNPGYPLHTIESCCYLDETGGIISSYKRNIILFPTCDQTILDQINYWSFAPYIAPRAGCSNTPPEWKPACPSGDCGTQNCTNGDYTTEESVSSSAQ